MVYIILVCGCRYYDDVEIISSVLGVFRKNRKDIKIIQGGSGRVDTVALAYQEYFRLKGETYRPDKKKFGTVAESFRNQKMIDIGQPNVILAFHKNIKTSKATIDIIRKGLDSDISTYLIPGLPNTKYKITTDDLENFQ